MKPIICCLFVLSGLCAGTNGFGSNFGKSAVNQVLTYVEGTLRAGNHKQINANEPVPDKLYSSPELNGMQATTSPVTWYPTISASTDSITGVFYQYMDSPPLEYTIWADDLTSELVITAFSEEHPGPGLYDITISLYPETDFATQLTIYPDENGHIDNTTIYVLISSSWFELGDHIGSIIHVSNEASPLTLPVNILCTCPSPLYIPVVTLGNIVSQPETIVFVPFTATGFQYIANAVYQIDYNPQVLTFNGLANLTNNNFIGPICYDIVLYPISDDHTILEINLFPYTGDIWLSVPDDEKLFDLEFLFHTGTSLLSFIHSNYNLMWGCGLEYIEEPFEDYHHNGSVSQAPLPAITFDPPTGLVQDVDLYTGCGPSNSFIISGSNLTSDLTIELEDFLCYAELSLTEEGEYVTSLILPNNCGTIVPTMIFVRLCVQGFDYCHFQAFLRISGSGILQDYLVRDNILPGNAPVTTIANVTAEQGSTIEVPITVVNFENISFASYYIDYNPNVLTFLNIIPDVAFLEDACLSDDVRRTIISLGYSDDYCWSVPDKDTLFSLIFFYSSGSTNLTFADPPDHNFQKCYGFVPNEEPFEDYHQNGSVSEVIKKLNLKLYLESLYDPVTDRMYKVQGDAGDRFQSDTTDVVTVKLMQTEHPYPLVVIFENVALRQNGSISIQLPDSLTGNYYLVVAHRNSIETWSSAPVSFSGNSISYDFSNAASKSYGNNVILIGGKFCIYGGDVNQDGALDTGDMTPVDNDSSGYLSGYLATDANGDGIIDTADITIVDNNSAAYVGVVRPLLTD